VLSRLLRIVTAGLLATLAVAALVGPTPAHAEQHGVDPVVEVVEVSGLLDPVLTDMMAGVLAGIDPHDTVAVVFQVNSTGAVVDDGVLRDLAAAIERSPVPISFWVGPSGARATGPVAQLVGLADDVGIAPGARLGAMGRSVLGDGFDAPFGLSADTDLVSDTVGFDEAVGRGLAREAPVLLAQLVGLDGFEVRTDESGDQPTVEPVTRTRFSKLDVVDQFFHTVASPAVAYLLLLVAFGLLVFELFTAGVGIAGVIGAGCLLFGSYGVAVLPARWWAVALLVVAFFGYAVDIQTGVPRAWTVIGTTALVSGSLFLFDGTPVSWITILVGIVGTVAAMAAGMPAMVRTRFSTPTIGREWMIGEMGRAVDALGPNGTVTVRDAVWRARTNRATPVPAGAPVRVVGVEGLWLEVEPEEGGARDYRERSSDT